MLVIALEQSKARGLTIYRAFKFKGVLFQFSIFFLVELKSALIGGSSNFGFGVIRASVTKTGIEEDTV